MRATSLDRPRIRSIDRLPGLSGRRLVLLGMLSLFAATVPLLVGTPPSTVEVGVTTTQSAFYAYPNDQQTVTQQSKDRHECESLATARSGVDPAQSIGPTAPGGAASRLIDYRRALTACLGARGSNVSFPDTSRLWG